MIRLEVEKNAFNGNTTFTVTDGFNSKTLTIPSYQVSEFQIEQAQRDVSNQGTVDLAFETLKRDLGIF